MEDFKGRVRTPGCGFPRATRGWKRAIIASKGTAPVSPALRGDGSGPKETCRSHERFPPRYAGMEGGRPRKPLRTYSFPRATRGWKNQAFDRPADVRVSPALRGDGRPGRRCRSRLAAFPPRYAGMEGDRTAKRYSMSRFPRATRGWKDVRDLRADRVDVSPALRGDGRGSRRIAVGRLGFPPRYAGMEERPG